MSPRVARSGQWLLALSAASLAGSKFPTVGARALPWGTHSGFCEVLVNNTAKTKTCGLVYYAGPQPNQVTHAESGRRITFADSEARDRWLATQFGRRIARMGHAARLIALVHCGGLL